MSQDPIKEEFDLFADEYDDIVVNELKYTAYQRLPRKVIELLDRATASILDLGCGTGLSADLFFEKDFQVTGVDLSPKMIEEARFRPFKKLVCQSLSKPLKVGKAPFDAITCLGVLDFVSKPFEVVEKILSHLKPEGLLSITVPINEPHAADFPVNVFNEAQMEEFFASQQLKVVHKEQFLGYQTDEDTVFFLGYVVKSNAR